MSAVSGCYPLAARCHRAGSRRPRRPQPRQIIHGFVVHRARVGLQRRGAVRRESRGGRPKITRITASLPPPLHGQDSSSRIIIRAASERETRVAARRIRSGRAQAGHRVSSYTPSNYRERERRPGWAWPPVKRDANRRAFRVDGQNSTRGRETGAAGGCETPRQVARGTPRALVGQGGQGVTPSGRGFISPPGHAASGQRELQQPRAA